MNVTIAGTAYDLEDAVVAAVWGKDGFVTVVGYPTSTDGDGNTVVHDELVKLEVHESLVVKKLLDR